MLGVLFLHYVITWTLVRNTAGNLLGGGSGSATWYPLQPPPFVPRTPVPVENPIRLQWGNINPLFPFGPIGDGGLANIETDGGFGCTGYSSKVCPLSSGSGIVQKRGVVEVIDDKIIDESTGRAFSEEKEVIDVTNQFYPQYNPYGPPSYFPPSQWPYPYFAGPAPFGFQAGASRSLGDE